MPGGQLAWGEPKPLQVKAQRVTHLAVHKHSSYPRVVWLLLHVLSTWQCTGLVAVDVRLYGRDLLPCSVGAKSCVLVLSRNIRGV
jgi:hypothetical protein